MDRCALPLLCPTPTPTPTLPYPHTHTHPSAPPSPSELFPLKRRANEEGVSWRPPNAASDGLIARHARGLALDFPSDEPSVFFVGTEVHAHPYGSAMRHTHTPLQSGLVHKCSVSYNEEYLRTYTGHAGPVYSLKASPFAPAVFLTCSADWSARLWRADLNKAVLTFTASDLSQPVTDVAWAPHASTALALVAADGRVEVWDLGVNTLAPQVRHWVPEVAREDAVPPTDDPGIAPGAPAGGEGKAEGEDDDPQSARDGTAHGRGKAAQNSEARLYESDSEQEDGGDEEDEEDAAEAGKTPATVQPAMSCVLFAPNAPVLVCGDSVGVVRAACAQPALSVSCLHHAHPVPVSDPRVPHPRHVLRLRQPRRAAGEAAAGHEPGRHHRLRVIGCREKLSPLSKDHTLVVADSPPLLAPRPRRCPLLAVT